MAGAVLLSAALAGCAGGPMAVPVPDPRSPDASERLAAMMLAHGELGFGMDRRGAVQTATTVCDLIRNGLRTRDEIVQERTRMNDIDGDAFVDAIALYACPEQYTA